ncbi:hypothetical protein KIP69_12315 [Geobacter sulfurreducens]|jgi:hypothetical protein|uniref:Uncharacterized protein n=1 Tax=Geobacter sulfurreducens (strain ATCC 51573 / DSM 12127 / PCA) TaxID=243231 RepID=Q74A45_GEOSL|nr:hypothetical protein [Geobacter sulfurreducens]AAR35919.1 hypothetical protein GSU2546 [Geobacter sulfurreducens PCA]ADI85304.1 hypothetical protein KN400_2492 [Geobacter sulfurreducens KN400]AJY68835.1 hypothetical protein RW64_04065 [Geobacter sulfurreducens]QVW34371.1 hypothetical protein KIP69_12315 [Geobacter sulfurreducens]UAC03242.1 hypothetical protein KVP06_12780 [Geobacter sulfurreducens]
MDDKEKQEISLIGRLLSMEALLILMGIVSLGYGIARSQIMNIFWGVVILVGAVVLSFVRKKDWKKHWEELEIEKRRHEERIKARNEGEKDGKG